MLRPLVLAGRHDTRGEMGEAHGRVGLVDMLPAGSAGAVGVDPEIGFIDLNLDGVVNFGINEDRGKRSVAAGVGIEG